MSTANQHTTADDLLKMPPDGFRYELVKGVLHMMTPSGKKHGKLTIRIAVALDRHVAAHGLGEVYAAETGFRIASDPDTVRAPDVAFVTADRVAAIGDIEGFLPGPPDLAVEVVSPSDSFSEVEEKVFDWLESGVRMVIVVNSRKKTVTTYRSRSNIRVLSEQDVLDGEDVVPGWQLPLKAIFE
jgi:Uma2 family endonuclease